MAKNKCTNCKYHCKKCDEIKSKKPEIMHSERDTLCWCCKNSVPKKNEFGEYIVGCSWSINKIPVEGWKYSSKIIMVYKGNPTSYCVSECPQFERG